jgi:hypothetical protein
MRTPNVSARNQLPTVLSRRAGVSAAELAQQIGVSVATLHRLLAEIPEQIVTTGRARRTRYALRSPLRGNLAELPVFEIDRQGRGHPISNLALLRPQGSCMNLSTSGWPVPEDARDGYWDGLPYPLYDMRPQGYLGRQWARAQHLALAVSENPETWSDADVVWALSRGGLDLSGNWLVGDAAYSAWQRSALEPPTPLRPRALGAAYAHLAEQAIAYGVAGSGAGGEFPKFPALRERAGSATPHVLVKFSGHERSKAVRRWADLLVCEHLALQCAATMPDITSATSRIHEHSGRVFLEVERFDRHGIAGRSPLVSLLTLNAALLGEHTRDWRHLAQRLCGLGLLPAADAERTDLLWWFGRLIGNNDMHLGNLSFVPNRGMLTLAPTYDMLPMYYAPLPGGEVHSCAFEPALPLPHERAVWSQAAQAARDFWQHAAQDPRISPPFARQCKSHAVQLLRLLESAS